MAFRRRAPKEPTPPEIEPLSISESQWRGQQVEAARQLVERYCGTSEMPPSLASLDAAVAAWFDDEADDRPDVNDLVNAVAVAFGHHLAKAADLSWVLATDERGSEIALHRTAGDVLIYPTNLVAKRIVDDERGFIQPLYDQLAARTRDIPTSTDG